MSLARCSFDSAVKRVLVCKFEIANDYVRDRTPANAIIVGHYNKVMRARQSRDRISPRNSLNFTGVAVACTNTCMCWEATMLLMHYYYETPNPLRFVDQISFRLMPANYYRPRRQEHYRTFYLVCPVLFRFFYDTGHNGTFKLLTELHCQIFTRLFSMHSDSHFSFQLL